MTGVTLVSTARRWCTLLLAIALALRLLAPEGWMPAAGGGIMLCPGAGAAAHHQPATPLHPAGEHSCPFAQAATVAPPPAALAWTAPALPLIAVTPLRLIATVGRGLAAPPPPATGPPTFA